MEIKITVNVGGNDPIEIRVDVPEKGVEKKAEETPDENCVYYDESYNGWSKDPYRTQKFLEQQLDFCNEKLRARGWLVENEVRDCLGIPRTMRGQVVGWIWDAKHEKPTVVDFGLMKDYNRKFREGKSRYPILSFNVDGDILKYL